MKPIGDETVERLHRILHPVFRVEFTYDVDGAEPNGDDTGATGSTRRYAALVDGLWRGNDGALSRSRRESASTTRLPLADADLGVDEAGLGRTVLFEFQASDDRAGSHLPQQFADVRAARGTESARLDPGGGGWHSSSGCARSTGSRTASARRPSGPPGTIMTSGYIDGWANVLQTTNDMSTPSFVYGPSTAVIEQMGSWPDKEMVFVLDSKITADGTDVDLTVYTFPQLEPLVDLIQDIEVDTDVHADTVADESVIE